MRVGCLQFAPKLGEVDHNLTRADAILARAEFDNLDMIVLPEMAFTGMLQSALFCGGTSAGADRIYDHSYLTNLSLTGSNFVSRKDRAAFLEPSTAGVTSLWVRTAALKYGYTVAAGYHEPVNLATAQPTSPEHYSSVIMVDATGETLANHSGSVWDEREERFSARVIPGLDKVSIGHCTDLGLTFFMVRKSEFSDPEETQAFARHILQEQSKVAVISMAWETAERPRKFSCRPQEPDMDSLTCWVRRLEPLIRAEMDEEVIVILCNRAGSEGSATYAGTSAVIGISGGEVLVYGLLGRCTKELLVVDTANGPIAKLVSRPDEDGGFSGELDEGSSDDVDVSEMEPLTPESPIKRPNPVEESPQKSTLEATLLEENALSIVVGHLPLTNPGPTTALKRTAAVRPRVVIPTSISPPLQEMKADEYQNGSLVVPVQGEPECALNASAPYPHGSIPWRRFGPNEQTGNGNDFQHKGAITTPVTAFQDFTPISAFPDWPNRGNGPALLDGPLTASSSRYPEHQILPRGANTLLHSRATGQGRRGLSTRPGTPQVARRYFAWPRSYQSSTLHTENPGFKASPVEDGARVGRPVSPKSRNALSADSSQLNGGEEVCGAITILASPSIIVKDSYSGVRSRSRGRARHRKSDCEDVSRSSSCDSTRNELLHRKVKSSDDRTARTGSGQRSKSTSEREPEDGPGRNRQPQLRKCQSQVLGTSANAMVRRAGFNSWPISREELQRAANAIHESLIKHG